MSSFAKATSRDDFSVSIICALPREADAVTLLFDEFYDNDRDIFGRARGDTNDYVTGRIDSHHVVLTILPAMGTTNAAAAVANLRSSYSCLKLALLVGVCGGVPKINDCAAFLGDVVISKAIVQYDYGRQYPGHFAVKNSIEDSLGRASKDIRNLLIGFETELGHERLRAKATAHLKSLQEAARAAVNDGYCPNIFVGRLGSGNSVMKSGEDRDHIATEHGIIGFEMEGAGAWDEVPCIVIKGICDYADSHKNKRWQDFAAATAASVARALLERYIREDASGVRSGGASSGFQAGTTQGAVHHYASLERVETPLNPSILIPFNRDKDFVERGILDQIHRSHSRAGSRTALVGLGGVGKSQLAIEYAYQVRERSPQTWVFWIHASNAARFEQGFRDIANCARILGRQDPKTDVFQLVHDWLYDRKRGQWVLILDNVDDAGFLTLSEDRGGAQASNTPNASLQPLISYIPHCQHGSVLFTTRSKVSALELVEEADTILVEPMAVQDAVKLFQNKSNQALADDPTELVAALEYMPLAIVQAAAYITQRWPRCSVQQYLEDFQASDRKKTGLLSYEGGKLRRDVSAKNSILITWQISFDYIRKTRPSAADMLSLMSFCDRQGIPEILLRDKSPMNRLVHQESQIDNREGADEDESENEESDGDFNEMQSEKSGLDGFEDDVLTLRNYSFVVANEEGITFEMHRLVQLATLEWLDLHGQKEQWRHRFITKLYIEMPTGEYENWTKCQALLPHARSAVEQKPKIQESLQEWATVMYRTAWYALRKGNGMEAERLSVLALKVRKRVFGIEHEEVLWAMNMVALVYDMRGRWEAAEKLFVQIMETRKTKLGADHPDTLLSIANLASTYRNQGRWLEAEKLQVQVVETRKINLGANHPSTLTSMANLASTYRNQGRWLEAEKLEVQVMETRKINLGANHPSTLTSMANLASTYRNQGRWLEAEKLEVQVMEAFEVKLGADHPSTLTSMANLSSTYRNQGRLLEAEKLEVQVMEAFEVKLGADHPSTLTSIANLALTYRDQGRWSEAEKLGVQVMETRKTKLGPDHPDTLISMANLASTYRDQGRWSEAEKLEVQVMETHKIKLGADHPDTLTSMANLALTYKRQGRWSEAEKLEVQAMETRKIKLGADHPDTLTSMANLASTFWNQGRLQAAEELEVRVLETHEVKLGLDHPDTLTSMHNLACTYWSQDRSIEAVNLMRRCIQGRETRLGVEHPAYSNSAATLAEWEYKLGVTV